MKKSILSIAIVLMSASAVDAKSYEILSSNEGCVYKSSKAGKNTTTFSGRKCASGARFNGSFSIDPVFANRRLYVKEGLNSLFVRIDNNVVDVFKVKVPGCNVSASRDRSNVVGNCDGVVVNYGGKPLLVGFGGHVALFDPYTGIAQGVIDTEKYWWTDRADIPQLQETRHWWGDGMIDLFISAQVEAGQTGRDYVSVTHSILQNVGRYNQTCDSLGGEGVDARFDCELTQPLTPLNDASAVLFDAMPDVINAGIGMSTVAMCRKNFRAFPVPYGTEKVLIDCLTNDVTYSPEESDIFIAVGYLDLIFEARRRAPVADVVVVDEFPRFDSAAMDQRTEKINRWVSDVLAEAPEQARTVDLYELAGLTFADYSDNVHLNETGLLKVSVAIADEVFE